MIDSLQAAIRYVPEALIVRPLRTLYFHGPRFMGWGGWEGLPLEDICAQMTLVSASVWRYQLDHCEELVERKFQTFLVTVGAFAYGYVLVKLVSYIWFRYFVLAPLLAEFRKHFPERIQSAQILTSKHVSCGPEKAQADC